MNCFRCISVFGLGAIAAILLHSTLLAEILPTKGTFRGIYRVSRGGLAQMEFFVLPDSLKAQLAPFDGKYIEMEVIKGSQGFRDLVFVEQIGKVTELPASQLELKVAASPSKSGVEGAFDITCRLINRGDTEQAVDGNGLIVTVNSNLKLVEGKAQNTYFFFPPGYTFQRYSSKASSVQPQSFLYPREPGACTWFYVYELTLRPREEAVYVLHSQRLEEGELEIVATMRDRQGTPLLTVANLNLPLPPAQQKPEPPLHVHSEVKQDGEWFIVKGSISDNAGAGVSLFAKSDEDRNLLPGLVQLYSVTGESLPPYLDWPEPTGCGAWQKFALGKDGLAFNFRVKLADRFSQAGVAKIGFWTVTSRGLEQFVLSDGLNPGPPFEMPAWGKPTQGCRMRIRTPKSAFKSDEPVRWFFQAESDGSEVDAVWVDGLSPEQVQANFDGRTVPALFSTGLYVFPFQGEGSTFIPNKFPPGRHKLQFIMRGNAKTYIGPDGRTFRKIDRELVSNEIEFEVLPPAK